MTSAQDVIPHPAADAAMQALAGHLAGERHEGRRFSSDLSVDEAILLKEVGYEPRGLVVGSCIYHIGLPRRQWAVSEEVTDLTRAMYEARERAVGRMVEDCRRVGGAGVVGVRLDVKMYSAGHGLAEFLAMGTAIAGPPSRQPIFTSDLSGQDFYLLTRAGYAPLGLVMGACVYHVAHQGIGQWLSTRTQNVELTQFTEAIYDARELAMVRMQDESRRVGAEGIVAVRVEEKSHVWGSHVIEFLAIGTGVRLVADSHQRLDPRAVVPLNDAAAAGVTETITEGAGGE